MKEKHKFKKSFTFDIGEGGPMFQNMHGAGHRIFKMKQGKNFGGCCTMGMDKSGYMNQFGTSAHGNIHQEINNATLFLYIELPGIDKSSLKIRAKPNKVAIEAKRKELPLYTDGNVNLKISLHEEIIPDTAKASYSDGVLKISFPIANPGYEVTEID